MVRVSLGSMEMETYQFVMRKWIVHWVGTMMSKENNTIITVTVAMHDMLIKHAGILYSLLCNSESEATNCFSINFQVKI